MRYLLLLMLAGFFSCAQKDTKTETTTRDSAATDSTAKDSLVNEQPQLSTSITETGFASIEKTMSYADLEKKFGKENIRDDIDYAPEALDSYTVTKIYPNTPKELVVEWLKGKVHKTISGVYAAQENSPYKTEDGLGVGSTLAQLLSANGKKIDFTGVGWDYGGMISSYNNGKYEKSKIIFYLDGTGDLPDAVIGDQALNTDMPKVKPALTKLKIGKVLLHFSDQPD